MLNGSHDADSHKGVPFGGFVNIVSYLGGVKSRHLEGLNKL